MERKQIALFINTVTQEEEGKIAVLEEDLSNIVAVGKDVDNVLGYDTYAKKLVNVIGKVKIVDRVYKGDLLGLMRDDWEYGSMLQKIHTATPEAQDNESWRLEHGTSYDPNIFYQPEVYAQYWNQRDTFEIPVSYSDRQIKESFRSAVDAAAFVSMISTSVENGINIKLQALRQRVLNNLIGETINSDVGTTYENTGIKAVNLLTLYNDTVTTPLDAEEALTSPDFLRFATLTIKKYRRRLVRPSVLFNVNGSEKFTPVEKQRLVLLADFAEAAETYLLNGLNQVNTDAIKLPEHETVAYWQGSGTGYDFEDVSSLNIALGSDSSKTVEVTGILGVLFDEEAAMVACLERYATSEHNNKAEFTNIWEKVSVGLFNDLTENCVVFYVYADET